MYVNGSEFFSVYQPAWGEDGIKKVASFMGSIPCNREGAAYFVIELKANGVVEGYFSRVQVGVMISWIDAQNKVIEHVRYHSIPTSENSGDGKKPNLSPSQPKPRFHKKRKPVPKRKKTDVVITYENDMTYTLKNITSIMGKEGNIIIEESGYPSKGVKVTTQIELDKDEVRTIHIKTPKGEVNILVSYDYYVVEDTRIGHNTTRASYFHIAIEY